VVKQITVAQGAVVEKGTPLLQLDDVEQRNELQIAREQVAVADARYQRASRSAIQSEEGRKELAVALAELQLARAEAAFAEEQLRQTGVIAQRDGIAVYTDKRDWEGRPVRAGEAILQIADPEQIEFSIDLPVSDSIVLRDGARIKVYLDSDPLRAIDAEIIATSYQPRLDKRQILSFRLRAQLPVSHDEPLPRIGTQGNARIFGDTAPLIYVLLRRPLTALRQTLGV
jgi:multidrug efflux pump subunit AcrA (membrane-fusion protein)